MELSVHGGSCRARPDQHGPEEGKEHRVTVQTHKEITVEKVILLVADCKNTKLKKKSFRAECSEIPKLPHR